MQVKQTEYWLKTFKRTEIYFNKQTNKQTKQLAAKNRLNQPVEYFSWLIFNFLYVPRSHDNCHHYEKHNYAPRGSALMLKLIICVKCTSVYIVHCTHCTWSIGIGHLIILQLKWYNYSWKYLCVYRDCHCKQFKHSTFQYAFPYKMNSTDLVRERDCCWCWTVIVEHSEKIVKRHYKGHVDSSSMSLLIFSLFCQITTGQC